MNRSRALELLIQSKPLLAARYGVTQLALFGSTARNAARSCDPTLRRRQSVSDSAQREWRFYLDDMIGFAEKVILRGTAL